MLIWILFAAMTGVMALALLLPLARRRPAVAGTGEDVAFYRAQLAEIDRDVALGVLPAAEAEAARIEASRRLLRAAQAQPGMAPEGEGGLRRRRAASALVLSMVPLMSVAFYGAVGSPHLPDQPLQARLATDPARLDLAAAVARIEAHLLANPDDGRGWDVIAPIYLRMGRYDDAARAFGEGARLHGESPRRVADRAEALTLAKGGVVPEEARTLFQSVLAGPAQAEDGTARAKARYFLALALEQDGDRAAALSAYESLLVDTPADAPWRARVADRIASLRPR